MARLPDHFDLWLRKARECADSVRQLDYVLGALAGQREWHFLNAGTREYPNPAVVEMDEGSCLLVFSDAGRIEDMLAEGGHSLDSLPVISIPAEAAMKWCVTRGEALLVNQEVFIPAGHLCHFAEEWEARGATAGRGFWIPNLTSQEEDFWQQHGV